MKEKGNVGIISGEEMGRRNRPERKEGPRMKKWIGLMLAVMMLAALAASAMAEEQGREM